MNIKLYKTYNKVRKLFIRPKLRSYIGGCAMGLPIFRPKKWIHLCYRDIMWKDKYNTPRFEFAPQWNLTLFGKWQIMFWLDADDTYWEMLLWTIYYSDCNIIKAQQTWDWIDGHTKESTWNDDYLRKIL